MVPPSSGRLSRVPPYSGTEGGPCPYGAVTRSGPAFQPVPVRPPSAAGLVRVRSPLLTESRLMSFPPGTEMFQFPGLAPRPYGFGPRYPLSGVGCPIRRPPDRSPLAAPRGFSQRAASFLASWRQGIRQVPFLSLDPPSGNGAARRTPAGEGKPRKTPGTGRPRRRPEGRGGRPARPVSRLPPHDVQRARARPPRGAPRPRRSCPAGSPAPGARWWWWWWWWARADSNGRPHAYQACALTG